MPALHLFQNPARRSAATTAVAPAPAPPARSVGAAWALAGASALLGITPAAAQSPPAADLAAAAAEPVVAIVRVPKPWWAPRALVASRMRKTMPEYASLPGLAFKAYTFEQQSGDFGGVYLWRDRAGAAAWFDAAWFERVRRERGVDATVVLLDAPLSIDNVPGGTALDEQSNAVVTWIEIPLPGGLDDTALRAGFAAAAPAYRPVPGLLRKHFTQDGRAGGFGGVYVWRDAAAATAHFDAAWHAQVRQRYGAVARITWFDAPILLPGTGLLQPGRLLTAASATTVRP